MNKENACPVCGVCGKALQCRECEQPKPPVPTTVPTMDATRPSGKDEHGNVILAPWKK
jgi:hypothetical protein